MAQLPAYDGSTVLKRCCRRTTVGASARGEATIVPVFNFATEVEVPSTMLRRPLLSIFLFGRRHDGFRQLVLIDGVRPRPNPVRIWVSAVRLLPALRRDLRCRSADAAVFLSEPAGLLRCPPLAAVRPIAVCGSSAGRRRSGLPQSTAIAICRSQHAHTRAQLSSVVTGLHRRLWIQSPTSTTAAFCPGRAAFHR